MVVVGAARLPSCVRALPAERVRPHLSCRLAGRRPLKRTTIYPTTTYALIVFAIVIMLVVAIGATMVDAAEAKYEGVGARHAAAHVRKAKAELRDAQRVLVATRRYDAAYGAAVGRWVWLADDVGWPSWSWPRLFMIIDRESGGFPGIMNSQGSGAAGLLQLMPGWYCGDYYNFPTFNPRDPRKNLYYGHRGWLVSGWAPWSL